MMTLQDWLDKHEVSQTGFAEALDVRPSTINDLCNGRRRPSLELAVKIERATFGQVPPASWIAAA
jgi:plasmid maintenance system antidote protein VapI